MQHSVTCTTPQYYTAQSSITAQYILALYNAAQHLVGEDYTLCNTKQHKARQQHNTRNATSHYTPYPIATPEISVRCLENNKSWYQSGTGHTWIKKQHEVSNFLIMWHNLDLLSHLSSPSSSSPLLVCQRRIRFSVHNVFNFFPEANKAIILEDDLLLSPDFIS